MKLIIFALIPLILSIGISPALQFDVVPNADAVKAKGNSLTEINSKKVCGDRLCSELEKQEIPEEIMKEKVVEDSMQEENIVYDDGMYQLVKIAENIYSFGTSMGSFSLVMVTNDGIIIGDPVNQNHSEIMLKAIRTITDQPIKYLVYSHTFTVTCSKMMKLKCFTA